MADEVLTDEVLADEEALIPRLDQLPDDLVKQILLSTLGAGCIRYACCSRSCLSSMQSDPLWRELCDRQWPNLAQVLAFVRVAPTAFQGPIIPDHLAFSTNGRDVYHARFLATQAALRCKRVDLISLYDESIVAAAAVAEKQSLEKLVRLSQVLSQIDEAGHCDMGRTDLAPEGRAWLWLLASLLLQSSNLDTLCEFAKAANARLDEWYDVLEAGGEAVDQWPLLTAALRDRSALEAVLTVLQWWVTDVGNLDYAEAVGHNYVAPGSLASALETYVESALAGLRRISQATIDINNNILGMRAEGCDLSVPSAFRPQSARRVDVPVSASWWWHIEAPMHVSGGNPYVQPLPAWMNANQAGQRPDDVGMMEKWGRIQR